MKKIIILLILQVSLRVIAQDCAIEPEIQNNYLSDAKILALREIYSDSTNVYTDSIELSSNIVDKYLGALSMIYSMNNGASDTVFNVYDIHIFPYVSYKEIAIIADTSYSWIQNYLIDSVTSGNAQFDSIMVKYDFKLRSYLNLSAGVLMSIITPHYLNLIPIVDSLRNIEGLDEVKALVPLIGDGNNIEFSNNNDTTIVDFSIGWGDCLAGCINRIYWKFSIHSCSASYLGSSRDISTSIHDLDKNDRSVYPNPVNDILTIEKWVEVESIDIYDLYGRLINSYDQVSNQIDLSGLTKGLYILKIQSNNNNDKESIKIIKR